VDQNDEMVHMELRLTIRGSGLKEWYELAQWIESNELYLKKNMFVIQVPRAYRALRSSNMVSSFGELIANIFRPLFDAMIDPQANASLVRLMDCIAGFDSVDDESLPEKEDGTKITVQNVCFDGILSQIQFRQYG
jgi:AMP deaminase